MIDYVKIKLQRIDINRLINKPELNFITEVSENTGELSRKSISDYHFCSITIYNTGTVMFAGSIHKLWNSLNNIKAPNYNPTKSYKGYNGNLFTLLNVYEVINHLENLFDCNAGQMTIQNIEFGINTTPDFNQKLYLDGLLYHNGKPFEFRHHNNYAQTEHDQYLLKIYNKSYQYGMSTDTLRIEIKVIRMREIHNLGIHTIADINSKTITKAENLLLMRFNEVVYYDYTINKKNLTGRKKSILDSYSNVRYWLNDLKPNQRFRHKQKLQYFIDNFSENLHQKLTVDFNQKCSIIHRLPETSKCSINHTSSISGFMHTKTTIKDHKKEVELSSFLNLIETQKKCKVTGIKLDLEQNTNTNYIRTKTLRYLQAENKDVFLVLVNEFLNHSLKRPKYEKDIITHLAKQIRNRYYNPRPIKQTGYKKRIYDNQLLLDI